MLEVSDRAKTLKPAVDTVLFDMDGVLLDVTNSIREALIRTVPYYLREVLGWPTSDSLITTDDVERFKNAGGFNDDIDLACALIVHYLVRGHENPDASPDTLNILQPNLKRYVARLAERGGGLKVAEEICLEHFTREDKVAIDADYRKQVITQVFTELFAGEHHAMLYGRAPTLYTGRGYVNNDVPLIDLSLINPKWKLGILTGRDRAEASFGLKTALLSGVIPEENIVSKSDGQKKPKPGGLLVLDQMLMSNVSVYIGDTLDDLRTVQNANRTLGTTKFLGALVLSGPAGAANTKSFRTAGPDILADDVNGVLRWLAETAE